MSSECDSMELSTSLSHDGYFRGAMLKVKILRCFLEKSLPKDLVDEIDFESLKPSKESQTSPELRTLYSDAVIDLKLKSSKSISVCMVLEHKSYRDKKDVLQLLTNVINKQHRYASENPKKPLVPTIPVIVSHTGKPRKSKTQIQDLYDSNVPDSISKRSIKCEYEVLDLNSLDESLFADDIETLLVFRTMRDIHGDILGSIRESLIYLADYAKDQSLDESLKDTMRKTIEYVNKSDKISEGEMSNMIATLREGSVRKEVLTLEKQLINKGKREGIAEGKREEKFSIARALKIEGVSNRIISISTGLTRDEIEDIDISEDTDISDV